MYAYYFKISLLPMTVGEQANIGKLLAPGAGSFVLVQLSLYNLPFINL
jgi:hypothetical protein